MVALAQLGQAYLRRKRLEAKMIAAEIVMALGRATSNKPAPFEAYESRPRKTTMSVVELLNEMSSPLR